MSTERKRRVVLAPGEVLRELRGRKGWTQAVLSEVTGVAVPNISNIESGRSRLGEKRAIVFAEALGVKAEFLLFPNGYEREEMREELAQVRRRVRKLMGEEAA